MAAGHVGRRPAFIEKHQPRRIEIELAIEPGLARAQDVSAALLGRISGLFCARSRAVRRGGVASRSPSSRLPSPDRDAARPA